MLAKDEAIEEFVMVMVLVERELERDEKPREQSAVELAELLVLCGKKLLLLYGFARVDAP